MWKKERIRLFLVSAIANISLGGSDLFLVLLGLLTFVFFVFFTVAGDPLLLDVALLLVLRLSSLTDVFVCLDIICSRDCLSVLRENILFYAMKLTMWVLIIIG